MQKIVGFLIIVSSILLIIRPLAAQDKPGQAYYDFAVFAFEEGDYANALKDLERALQQAPDEPGYHHLLGKTHMKMGNLAQSKHHYLKAYDQDPNLPGLAYDLGFLCYKLGDYSMALKMFEQTLKQDPDNRLARYHAGVASYKLEQYPDALRHLQQVPADKSDADINAAYYSAICHVKTHSPELAIERFTYVREHAQDPAVRDNADLWVQRLRRGPEAMEKPYRFLVKLGYQYDDNVRLSPMDIELGTDEDDWVMEGLVMARYNVIDQDGWVAGAGFSGLQTWHNDLNDYDITGGNLQAYLKYYTGPVMFGIAYLPTYFWLDDSSYLMRHHIRPEVTFYIGQESAIRLTYNYFDNNYFTDYGRDGHTNEVFGDVFIGLGDGRGYVYAGAGIEDVTAANPDNEYVRVKTQAGISINLIPELNLSIEARYQIRNHGTSDSYYQVKREDDKYAGDISLGYQLPWDGLQVGAEYTYTRNDSNITAYDYERNVVGGFVKVEF